MTYNEQLQIGRVITEHKASYVVLVCGKQYTAHVRGCFHQQEDKKFPKVGDYVELAFLDDNKVVIEKILPRTSEVVRKSAHDETVQVIVANIDYVFIVMGVDNDFNLRRLERYLAISNQAHITPVVILNKSDIAVDIDMYISQTKAIIGDVAVHAVSAKKGDGMEVFNLYLQNGKTGVLLGSSGAGKSTIINHLLKDTVQKIKDVRVHDSRGRHTTTVRQLFELPSTGFLIDTPGMRELGFIKKDDIGDTFSDIELLASKCRFPNCDHIKSDGCRVQEALQKKEIDQKHFDNYLKLQDRKAETRPARRK